MRKLFFFIISVLWAFSLNAQYTVSNRPYWIEDMPVAGPAAGFYYFVTSAEGDDVDKACQKAYTMAVLSFKSRVGTMVSTTNDSVTVENQQMRVRMNMACLYSEDDIESNRMRVFVLWQIAKSYTTDPGFVEFSNCYKPKSTEKKRKSKK